MLPLKIDDLRSKGFIDNGELNLGVVIEISESEFSWDDFLEKEAENILKNQPTLDFTDMFADVEEYKLDFTAMFADVEEYKQEPPSKKTKS